jgi:hypothetical protein
MRLVQGQSPSSEVTTRSSPCQDTLNWHSCHWDKAVGGMQNVGDLSPPGNKENGLVMMLGYAHGGYLMTRTTPSP